MENDDEIIQEDYGSDDYEQLDDGDLIDEDDGEMFDPDHTATLEGENNEQFLISFKQEINDDYGHSIIGKVFFDKSFLEVN